MENNRGILLSKVPQVTIFFWAIKILSTTVGETFADWINETLGLGLTKTSLFITSVLVVLLVIQMKAKEYSAFKYWAVVVFMSIAGTLVTDNLTDNLGVSLVLSTAIFGILLFITFSIWYREEKTISIKEVNTPRREAFYWLAILFTFAMGTAAGDLIAEKIDLGYGLSFIIFLVVIVGFIALWQFKVLGTNMAFWLCYIMTRPLGAASGDYLSQTKHDGGIGLGAANTSFIYLSAIVLLVIYLSVTKRDRITSQ